PRGGGAVVERGQPGGGYVRGPGPGAWMPARPPGATCGAAARSVVRKSLRPSEPQGRGGVRLSLNHKAAYRKLRPNAPRGAPAFAETVNSMLSGRSPGRSAPSPAAGAPGGDARTPGNRRRRWRGKGTPPTLRATSPFAARTERKDVFLPTQWGGGPRSGGGVRRSLPPPSGRRGPGAPERSAGPRAGDEGRRPPLTPPALRATSPFAARTGKKPVFLRRGEGAREAVEGPDAHLIQRRVQGAEGGDRQFAGGEEGGRVDAFEVVGGGVIVRMEVDAEIDERDPRRVERRMVRGLDPVVRPAVGRRVLAEGQRHSADRGDRLEDGAQGRRLVGPDRPQPPVVGPAGHVE